MSFQLNRMIKERRKRDSGPDVFTVNHVASIHNHKGPHASRALKGTSTPPPSTYITPPSPLTSIICKDQRGRHVLPVAETTQRSELTSTVVALCTPFTSSPPPFPQSFLLILSRLALAQCPGTSAGWICRPVGRQTTQYKLGADGDRVGYAWREEKGVKKKKEGDGSSDGGMVPKGVEVKRAGALICNSNEGC